MLNETNISPLRGYGQSGLTVGSSIAPGYSVRILKE